MQACLQRMVFFNFRPTYFIKSHYSLSSTNINYAHHRLICNTRSNLISCPLYDVLFNESVNNAIQLENPLQRTWPRRVRIVGSCNGLVCILVEDNNTLFIYNPSTRITNFLLGSKKGAVSFSVHGFGYDEMTHDYKVVKLYQTWPCWGTMIYSLKARSWKEIGLFPCPDPLSDGKFLNGALHWATGDGQSGNIVSLDLGKETYGEVLQPEYDEGSGYFELEVSGEWLCVLCDYYENRAVDVWVMKVYGVKDSWTKLASIRYPNIWGAQIFLASFCISEYGKLLLQFQKKLVVYDSKDNSSSVIDNECIDACIVVESLVSPFPSLGLADNNADED